MRPKTSAKNGIESARIGSNGPNDWSNCERFIAWERVISSISAIRSSAGRFNSIGETGSGIVTS